MVSTDQGKRKYKVAIIQLDTRSDKTANLEMISQFLDEAAAQGSDLVSLPEVFNVIPQERVIQSEPLDGPSVSLIRDKAKQHGYMVHGGSLLIDNPGELPLNTSLLIDSDGEILARYDKLHLYDVTLPDGSTRGESQRVYPGNQVVDVKTRLGHFGLTVCYDLRFPELYRLLALQGAEVLFIPANFMMLTGKDHWEVLLRARAIENGCYVIAAAQMGRKRDNEDSYGASMVVDPWGTVIAHSPNRTGVSVIEIDLDYVTQVRQMIPSLLNRRADVYHLE